VYAVVSSFLACDFTHARLLPLHPSDQYFVQPQNFFHRCPGLGVINLMGLPHSGHSGLSSACIFFIVLAFFLVVFVLRAAVNAENTLPVRDDNMSHLAFQMPLFLFIVNSSASRGPVSSVSSFGPLHFFEHEPHATVTLSLTDMDISSLPQSGHESE
jgi:hypothetical protein